MSKQLPANPKAPTQEEIASAQRTLFAAGIHARRLVTGPAHVAASLGNATPFSTPMVELVTSICWGTVWQRPGLALRTRSLINIALLSAMNRNTELGVHIRGAIRNGCSEEEIQEVLLHVSVYSGMPAGIEGFRVADRVLREMKEKGEGVRQEGELD